MSETLQAIALEMLVLSLLALLYYLWQRHRILHGPRHWPASKLVEVHQLALSCTTPESFRDLSAFMDDTEERLNSPHPWMDRSYIEKWQTAQLPENVRALLEECYEWLNQSQPKTR